MTSVQSQTPVLRHPPTVDSPRVREKRWQLPQLVTPQRATKGMQADEERRIAIQREDAEVRRKRAEFSSRLATAFPAPVQRGDTYVWDLVVAVADNWHEQLNDGLATRSYSELSVFAFARDPAIDRPALSDTHVEIYTGEKDQIRLRGKINTFKVATYDGHGKSTPGQAIIHAWYDKEHHLLHHVPGRPSSGFANWEELLWDLCPEFYQHHGDQYQHGVMRDIIELKGRYEAEKIWHSKFGISAALGKMLLSPLTIRREQGHRIP